MRAESLATRETMRLASIGSDKPGGDAPPEGAAVSTPTDVNPDDAMRPFLVGTAVGGVAGAVAGTLLSHQTRRLLLGLIHLVTRRLSDAERDELRFELLLQ